MTNLVSQIGRGTPLEELLDETVLDLPDRLLDLLPVGIYVCDPAGLIVRYNRAAAEL
jgi:PAS domain-containing protein